MHSPNAKRNTFQTYYRGKVCPDGSWGGQDLRIIKIILLNEKFLPFDWLRAEVFQHDLKYLHVKITVTMVTQNHQIISSHELRKNGGKISRFWNQEIQELKENSENQNTEKSTSTWLNVWTSWAKNKNFKTNLLAYEAKKLDENKHMALDDWISQVVVYRGYCMPARGYEFYLVVVDSISHEWAQIWILSCSGRLDISRVSAAHSWDIELNTRR